MAETVVVGMSGGVDSSVTAFLLKEAGYRVIGLFMRNWEEDEECPAVRDFQDVASVCTQLDIPYYSVSFAKEYWERVFARCLVDYERGETPNPDILCNSEIKFDLLLEKALALGGNTLATGHYAAKGAGETLLRGLDPEKDQSYFLYKLKSEQLSKVLFPLGEMQKSEVRALARRAGLATAEKRDSTGICFIGKRPFQAFLSRYIKERPGAMETLSGKRVGTHLGVAYYTIGQRKGLGIGGPGEPWFVLGKDVERNVLYVEQGEDHPALYSTQLYAHEVSWVGQEPAFPLQCTAKIRYRSADVECRVTKEGEQLLVTFEIPQKAVTTGQSVVFYQGRICLGGALIQAPAVAGSGISSNARFSPAVVTR